MLRQTSGEAPEAEFWMHEQDAHHRQRWSETPEDEWGGGELEHLIVWTIAVRGAKFIVMHRIPFTASLVQCREAISSCYQCKPSLDTFLDMLSCKFHLMIFLSYL